MTTRARWWQGSGPAIEIRIGFSPGLLAAGLLLHALAGAVIVALLGVGWGALCLLLLMSASFILWLRMAGLAVFGNGLARACWHEDETWTLFDRRGRACAARLDAGGFWLPRLVLLNWRREDGRRISALLRPGLEDQEEFRRLRARLRSSDAA